MSTVQSTGSSTATSAAASASASNVAADIGQQFLTLFISQLKNQDPLNPMDNAQLTSQLAQISTVTGINKVNDAIASLTASVTANQYLQAASLVGHKVLIAGSVLQLANGTGSGAFNLANAADQVTVTIKDSSGNVVRTLNLGAQAAGTQSFDWDGKTDAGVAAGAGNYSFSVSATASGKAIAATTYSVAPVTGVIPGANGTQLQLGSFGTVSLAAVTQIN